MSTAPAARTWGDVIEYRRGLACLINIQENIVGYVGDVVYHVAERGIKETELFYDASESDIRLALQWLALDRPPLNQPIPVDRGPWVPTEEDYKEFDREELNNDTVHPWELFRNCVVAKQAAQPQATAEQPKPAEPPSDLPPGYAAIPDPAFDRLCYHVESGGIYTRKLAKTGAPNPSDSQHALAGIVFVGWRFDPAKLAAWQAEQAQVVPSREFAEAADIEASVGLGMHDPDQAYLAFIGVLAERFAAMEARLAALESAKPQPVAVKYPDFDMSLFPTTVEEVRREEQRQAENPIEIPDELLDPARLLKPEPPTSEPDVPAGLLESDDGDPRYREADINVYPWVYGEAEYLAKNGIPASSVAEGLRLVVADAVKQIPAINLRVVPADAVVVQWSTEPPKEDGGGWAQLKNGECRAGFWRHRAGMHFAIGGLAIEAHDIARYLMLPRPGVKS